MAKKELGLVFWLLVSVQGFSQIDSVRKEPRFFLGLTGGLNFSKIHSDTLHFGYGTKPAMGAHWKYRFSDHVFLKNSILYSVKGSTSATPYWKFENSYVDFNLMPQYRFSNDFYFQTGLSYSAFVSSARIKCSGETRNGSIRYYNGIFESELNVITGLELKLPGNRSIEFNYFIPTSGNSTSNFQLSLNFSLNHREKRKKDNRSRQQIQELKSGTLLVRLRSSENKIRALKTLGNEEEATRVKARQEIENRKIVSAFKQEFTFCKVLFFYNTHSDKVRTKEFSNIFLNDSLVPDGSLLPEAGKPFFIAEFAPIDQGAARHYSHSTYEPDGNWSLQKVDHYYGGSNPGFEALIIRDSNFVQLKKPFPYFTRSIFNSIKQHPEQVLFFPPVFYLFQNWSYAKVVQRMNGNLVSFHRKCK